MRAGERNEYTRRIHAGHLMAHRAVAAGAGQIRSRVAETRKASSGKERSAVGCRAEAGQIAGCPHWARQAKSLSLRRREDLPAHVMASQTHIYGSTLLM